MTTKLCRSEPQTRFATWPKWRGEVRYNWASSHKSALPSGNQMPSISPSSLFRSRYACQLATQVACLIIVNSSDRAFQSQNNQNADAIILSESIANMEFKVSCMWKARDLLQSALAHGRGKARLDSTNQNWATNCILRPSFSPLPKTAATKRSCLSQNGFYSEAQ